MAYYYFLLRRYLAAVTLTSMIRAIIIEEDASAREHLRMMINEADEEIEIVGECASLKKAEEAVEDIEPELLFLNVKVSEESGFDLLDRIPPDLCEAILMSADESEALKALRYGAAGYVLKPVAKDELKHAIVHAKRRISAAQPEVDYGKLFDYIRNAEGGNDKIALPTPDGFLFIRSREIIRCESDKVYTWVHMNGGKKILCSYNIGEFRKILPDHAFFQVHKSHILSLQYVRSYNGKDSTVELTEGTIIPVSRRNKAAFLNNFKILSRGVE